MKNKVKSFFKSSQILTAIFIIAVAFIFFIGAITYKQINDIENSTNEVKQSYEISLLLEKELSILKDAETGQRGFLISNDSDYLQPYFESKKQIVRTKILLYNYCKSDAIKLKKAKELDSLIALKYKELDENLSLNPKDTNYLIQQKKHFENGKAIMDYIRYKSKAFNVDEHKVLEKRLNTNTDTLVYTPLLFYALILVTLILISFAYFNLKRNYDELNDRNAELLLYNEIVKNAEQVGNYGTWYLAFNEMKIYFSDNKYKMLGCEPNEFIVNMSNFFQYVHPNDLAMVEQKVNDIFNTKTLTPFQYRIITKNGNTIYVEEIGKIISTANGNEILIVLTVDITKKNIEKQALEKQNEALVKSNTELAAFNYVASHDLQEPLRKIQTYISRIEGKEIEHFSDNTKSYFERIKSAANRMRLLIDDLLQFTRTNKAEKIFANTDLNTLLNNTKEELSELIVAKNAIIYSETLPNLNVIPFQIQQLFINIIGNALKYSKENIAPQILISVKQKTITEKDNLQVFLPTNKSFYEIIIKDNGIGFDNTYSEQIFNLFNRLHTNAQYSGTGIGLAICKKIMDNHNGTITASGKEGEGATFTVLLPI